MDMKINVLLNSNIKGIFSFYSANAGLTMFYNSLIELGMSHFTSINPRPDVCL